jgi:hypothetical protein
VGVLLERGSFVYQNRSVTFNNDGLCTKSLLIKGGINHSPDTTFKFKNFNFPYLKIL